MRSWSLGIGLAAAALSVVTPAAAAPNVAFVDEKIVSYATAFPDAGEVLSDHVVVTDAELATVATTTTAIATESHASPDLTVDGPPEIECPTAEFASIQAAVLAAPPGSDIKVCPGQYNETVVVPKPVTLFAPRHQGEATQCPSDPATDPTRYAIVDSPGLAEGFRLEANGIVLEGFVVQGNSRGIVTSPVFSDYVIRHTIAQNNGSGIEFQGTRFESGEVQQPLVGYSCLRHNDGALISTTRSVSARIEQNLIVDNGVGLLVFGTGVAIVHNDVVNSRGNDLLGSRFDVRYNHLVGSALYGRLSSSEIAFNRIENGIGRGLHLEELGGNLITSNHVSGFTRTGMLLEQGRRNTVRRNRVEQNVQDGISLRGTSLNVLENNLSRDNGGAGLGVSSNSSVNTIEHNAMLGNGGHDCYDDTVGPGTAGTANFWISDVGKTENRPGLCRNATTTP